MRSRKLCALKKERRTKNVLKKNETSLRIDEFWLAIPPGVRLLVVLSDSYRHGPGGHC
jgi:hypothetical protein